jgi:hypothetical protein
MEALTYALPLEDVLRPHLRQLGWFSSRIVEALWMEM